MDARGAGGVAKSSALSIMIPLQVENSLEQRTNTIQSVVQGRKDIYGMTIVIADVVVIVDLDNIYIQ